MGPRELRRGETWRLIRSLSMSGIEGRRFYWIGQNHDLYNITKGSSLLIEGRYNAVFTARQFLEPLVLDSTRLVSVEAKKKKLESLSCE